MRRAAVVVAVGATVVGLGACSCGVGSGSNAVDRERLALLEAEPLAQELPTGFVEVERTASAGSVDARFDREEDVSDGRVERVLEPVGGTEVGAAYRALVDDLEDDGFGIYKVTCIDDVVDVAARAERGGTTVDAVLRLDPTVPAVVVTLRAPNHRVQAFPSAPTSLVTEPCGRLAGVDPGTPPACDRWCTG